MPKPNATTAHAADRDAALRERATDYERSAAQTAGARADMLPLLLADAVAGTLRQGEALLEQLRNAPSPGEFFSASNPAIRAYLRLVRQVTTLAALERQAAVRFYHSGGQTS